MTRRKMKLPEGWYPHNSKEVEIFIDNFKSINRKRTTKYVSGIVPHAGWYFSGEEAWNVICQIPDDTITVIVAGGHLPPGSRSLLWNQETFETPHGLLSLDKELSDTFCRDFLTDESTDNTIEIQLPFLSYLNADIKILPVRLPPERKAYDWGKELGLYCREINRKAFFLGSTDLTHYGPSYGNLLYSEKADPVKAALKQDRILLEALCRADISKAIESVLTMHTACSSGGALGAVGFAESYNHIPGEILSLTSSYDKMNDSLNFVNYGTVVF